MYLKRKGDRVENSRVDRDAEVWETDRGFRRKGLVERRLCEETAKKSTFEVYFGGDNEPFANGLSMLWSIGTAAHARFLNDVMGASRRQSGSSTKERC